MIKALLVLMAYITNPTYEVATYKPMWMATASETVPGAPEQVRLIRSCGASKRLMREKVKIYIDRHYVKVNRMVWNVRETVEDANPVLYQVAGYPSWGWGWSAYYKADDKAFMSMEILFNEREAFMSIQGIDAQRKKCMDIVYLQRVW